MDEKFRSAFELKDWLEQHEGTTLRAWLRHFDTNQDHGVTFAEFQRGMRAMGYNGDHLHIFELLDSDKSGELGMEEIDPDLADFWIMFVEWSKCTFADGIDQMLEALGGEEAVTSRCLHEDAFIAGMHNNGWHHGGEDLLFHSLDIDGTGSINDKDLYWLDVEISRVKLKEISRGKAQAQKIVSPTSRFLQVEPPEVKIGNFKQFLLRKYGGYMRAWRQGLCPWDGSSIAKQQFFKGCLGMAWKHDVKGLWNAFDKDGNGFISIDELDLSSAEVFARFQRFIMSSFGNTMNAFTALDMKGKLSMTQDDFATALAHYRFMPCTASDCKLLFHGLDREGTRVLVQSDLSFLDAWRPLPILTAQRNTKALELLKAHLVGQYRTLLKAWRRLLDKAGNNYCTWDHFCNSCKDAGFNQDLAGAWRAMDPDLKGSITFSCLDMRCGVAAWDFKQWAEADFGSLRLAFEALDVDGSNRLTFKEFRRGCRIMGYKGDWHLVFKTLDAESNGFLTRADVEALDPWTKDVGQHEQASLENPIDRSRKTFSKDSGRVRSSARKDLGSRFAVRRLRFLGLKDDCDFPVLPGLQSQVLPATPVGLFEGRHRKKLAHSSLGLAESVYLRPLRSLSPEKPLTARSMDPFSQVRQSAYSTQGSVWMERRAPKTVGMTLHSLWSNNIRYVKGSY
mmetsp:Transcript_10881/g.24716  ORF Transcript_10881/g.24716 Transcript_10881/m.24716 type:complete len:677 (+) Transcript_10881:150-2180(+)